MTFIDDAMIHELAAIGNALGPVRTPLLGEGGGGAEETGTPAKYELPQVTVT